MRLCQQSTRCVAARTFSLTVRFISSTSNYPAGRRRWRASLERSRPPPSPPLHNTSSSSVSRRSRPKRPQPPSTLPSVSDCVARWLGQTVAGLTLLCLPREDLWVVAAGRGAVLGRQELELAPPAGAGGLGWGCGCGGSGRPALAADLRRGRGWFLLRRRPAALALGRRGRVAPRAGGGHAQQGPQPPTRPTRCRPAAPGAMAWYPLRSMKGFGLAGWGDGRGLVGTGVYRLAWQARWGPPSVPSHVRSFALCDQGTSPGPRGGRGVR